MTVRVWPEEMETLPPEPPPPESEPMVSEEVMCRMAPAALAKVSEEESESAEPPETVRLPALIVVAPVNVFEPERRRVPEPFLVSVPPELAMAEEKVTLFAPVSMLKAWPAVVAKRLERSDEMSDPKRSVPPPKEMVPDGPRAWRLSMRSVPALMFVPPV